MITCTWLTKFQGKSKVRLQGYLENDPLMAVVITSRQEQRLQLTEHVIKRRSR